MCNQLPPNELTAKTGRDCVMWWAECTFQLQHLLFAGIGDNDSIGNNVYLVYTHAFHCNGERKSYSKLIKIIWDQFYRSRVQAHDLLRKGTQEKPVENWGNQGRVGEEDGQRCGLGKVQPHPGSKGFFGLRIAPKSSSTWKLGSDLHTPHR